METDMSKTLLHAAMWAAMGIVGIILGPKLYDYISSDGENISPADDITPPLLPNMSEEHKTKLSK